MINEFYEIYEDFILANKLLVDLLEDTFMRIKTWININGFLKIESAALFVCLLGILFDSVISGFIGMFLAVIYTGIHECDCEYNCGLHDFICCMIGVAIGMIIVQYV